MKIVGFLRVPDLHTRYQQIAMLDDESGELSERRLGSTRAGKHGRVRVGIEATRHTRWSERDVGGVRARAVDRRCRRDSGIDGAEAEDGRTRRGDPAGVAVERALPAPVVGRRWRNAICGNWSGIGRSWCGWAMPLGINCMPWPWAKGCARLTKKGRVGLEGLKLESLGEPGRAYLLHRKGGMIYRRHGHFTGITLRELRKFRMFHAVESITSLSTTGIGGSYGAFFPYHIGTQDFRPGLYYVAPSALMLFDLPDVAHGTWNSSSQRKESNSGFLRGSVPLW
jgi:hypothetical protein